MQKESISAAHSHHSSIGPASRSDCPGKMPWRAPLSPVCCVELPSVSWREKVRIIGRASAGELAVEAEYYARARAAQQLDAGNLSQAEHDAIVRKAVRIL